METENKNFGERVVNKIRLSPTFRLFIIGVLILVMLIPSGMIERLINERRNNHDTAVREISDKWGHDQTLTGPILVVPFYENETDGKGKVYRKENFAYYLPEDLHINGKLISQKRHRGIYEAVLYESKLHLEGDFKEAFLNASPIPPSTAIWSEAKLLVGISDVRGIRDKVALNWNDTSISATPGVTSGVLQNGIQFPLGGIDLNKGGHFSFDITFTGSQSLYFSPLAKNNDFSVTSNWPSPSYDGAFLPVSHSNSDSGFKANWKVLELNRNVEQHWNGINNKLNESDFGVKMWIAADQYQKTYRSVKYCVLFISLTFIFYFIVELRASVSVHPVQYILIGLAISIFYLLLLSVSEWLGFDTAYFVSASAVTTLITLFSLGVLNSKFYSMIAGGIQLLLYLFLYTTLRLEDMSLLIGTIGLFIALVILMYFSRQLNREPAT